MIWNTPEKESFAEFLWSRHLELTAKLKKIDWIQNPIEYRKHLTQLYIVEKFIRHIPNDQ